jgi:hypothetical protein
MIPSLLRKAFFQPSGLLPSCPSSFQNWRQARRSLLTSRLLVTYLDRDLEVLGPAAFAQHWRDHDRLAMRGARTGYLVFSPLPTIVEASATFAQAAKEAGLDLIVNMFPLSPKFRAMLFDKLFNRHRRTTADLLDIIIHPTKNPILVVDNDLC